MTASTRFASWISFLALATAIASAQNINPATQIKWPPCTVPGANVYSIPTNTCIVASGGGGGGGTPNPPAFSIQFAAPGGSLFSSDPTITIDPVLHIIHVGTPNSNPTFHLKPLSTIAADWTMDVSSPQTAIDSLTLASLTNDYVWTYHLGHGSWRAPAAAGVTQLLEGTNITLSSNPCTGPCTINATVPATAWSAITGGTNTGQNFLVGNSSTFGPTGTGKITATHSTLTGVLQCLEADTTGLFVGTGKGCDLWSSLTGGTLVSQALHLGSGASLDRAGGGTIDSSAIDGVTVSGTHTNGFVPVLTGSSTAVWQSPPNGTTTTCNANGCFQLGADGSLLEWGTVTATGGGTGGTFTITLPQAMTTTANQWVEVQASYCNLGSPSACAAGAGGSNASTPTGALETASTTAPTIAWWDANTAPGTIQFTWTARGK